MKLLYKSILTLYSCVIAEYSIPPCGSAQSIFRSSSSPHAGLVLDLRADSVCSGNARSGRPPQGKKQFLLQRYRSNAKYELSLLCSVMLCSVLLCYVLLCSVMFCNVMFCYVLFFFLFSLGPKIRHNPYYLFRFVFFYQINPPESTETRITLLRLFIQPSILYHIFFFLFILLLICAGFLPVEG